MEAVGREGERTHAGGQRFKLHLIRQPGAQRGGAVATHLGLDRHSHQLSKEVAWYWLFLTDRVI